jgi:hypothetical protein
MYDGYSIMPAPAGEPCFLPLYDVGMTGLYLSMVEVLAEMATVLGKNDTAAELTKRHINMTNAANKYLWNEEQGMYCNLESDSGKFSTRVSPFNFHLMLSGAATEERAERMVKGWMMSEDGFCVNATTPSPTNDTGTLDAVVQPTSATGKVIRTYYSQRLTDNAVCFAADGCGACGNGGQPPSGLAAPNCPTDLASDQEEYYTYWRDEGSEMSGKTKLNLKELHFFYSAAANDNFVGFNATDLPGYKDMGGTGMMVALEPCTTAYPDLKCLPLDIYYSEKRKDYQAVASPISRKHLDNQYKMVQRLGWVQPPLTPAPTPAPAPTPDSSVCAYGMPSIAHNDSAYKDQDYWRGRVWGPMNFLVYAGLSHPRYAKVSRLSFELIAFISIVGIRCIFLTSASLSHQLEVVQQAKKALAAQSQELLLVEWLDKHHVHENFNAMTGRGGDVHNSNPFYHWGALLGWISLKEE